MNVRVLSRLRQRWSVLRRYATKPSSVPGEEAGVGSGTGIGNITGRARGNASSLTVNQPSTKIVTHLPPLTDAIPNLPEVEYARPLAESSLTQVTTLANGLRVASEPRFGQFCTVGLVIDSGPRYEVTYPSGVSHFLEKLAFNSTEKFPNKDAILKELEKNGGICDCQSSRDTLIYAASIDSRAIESVTRLLADVTLRPTLHVGEVSAARKAVQFELETLGMRPEQEPILMDMIHAAAYRDNTLGLPKLCPSENLPHIDRNVLMNYLKYHHTPERMVIAGVGVNHDELVRNVEKYFVEESAIWETQIIKGTGATEVDASIAQYTGGLTKEECEIPIYAATGLPELAHVVIGLEGCSHQDPDFVALCVLNIMMGGGGSFSAGGPGKGMYSRLYTNVLNRYHWMYSATAYNHAYADTGLFCIHASAPPSNVRDMVEVVTRELVNMACEPSKDELSRSKIQLQSMLLMNLESRPVVFEDVGRQVLATGHRKRPEHFIREIEKIKQEDIQRVSRRLLATPPSMAARGDIGKLPELKEVQNALSNGGRLYSRRLSLFK
ncbi:mitochondrial-processing peptidase subunit alpha [Rhagoletis pomonella]|uniref:mitochondrial-processing peptidase subunit alpha n=1 Tax=Rhagoletis pomonella TaxID=28610 RepID=UPI00177D46B6|nr:mitochondrial-processing peptidase subunit alpha [Rhagoletis pomonella]